MSNWITENFKWRKTAIISETLAVKRQAKLQNHISS